MKFSGDADCWARMRRHFVVRTNEARRVHLAFFERPAYTPAHVGAERLELGIDLLFCRVLTPAEAGLDQPVLTEFLLLSVDCLGDPICKHH